METKNLEIETSSDLEREDPKYLKISKDIIEMIESGKLKAGDKVPSENELIANYGVSNTTARKALLDLETKGLATRIKGKGTFVLYRIESKHLVRQLGTFASRRQNYSDNFIRDGYTPKVVILEKTVLKGGFSINIEDKYFIMDGDVLKIHQLRYANEKLMKDEKIYISMKHCPEINLVDLDQPLVEIYESRYGLNLSSTRMLTTHIEHAKSSDNYFDNEEDMACFKLTGLIFHNSNELIEIETSKYRGDMYSFSIDSSSQGQYPSVSI